ncbi:hypothetical protein [Candidatus Enterococcus clewellii]|uniref:Uncharacterized protein n=1 Tax=Candidatus Enterococcus clewellii TaxID=1834193 RepID=A0A242K8Q7_9ENTE|nr:hypothetical protein [Enterococcus sp. 9E7_DIV0242]OTP17554.1 hypothetical protein A5888_001692 [Enterococcus sp. 9E7_DIV0242]
MLTAAQNHLVREAIREKAHNLGQIIQHESAKPLGDQNLKQLDSLTAEWHEYNKIYDELVRVGC